MRVLLTGAAGFIGGAIADQLRAAGDEVVAVDCMLPAAHGSAAVPEGVHDLDVRQAADAEEWAALLDGIDVVCHQAAMVGAGVTPADLPAYAGHNDLGNAALLAGMYAAGVSRFVFASSMVVYGEGRYACPTHGVRVPQPRAVAALDAGDFDNHCDECGAVLAWESVAEETELAPRSSYAASKVAQEHYTLAWARQAGGAAIGLRYHNVYGPLMPKDTPYSGVAAIFRSSLERGEAPQVFEDGAQMRDFVHVDDVARANVLALRAVAEAPAESYAAYNVASGHPIAIREVAEMVGEGAGRPIPPEVTGQYRLGDVRHIVASPERARTELGFTAEVTPDVGLPAFATAPLRS
ncbi:NAD-dependent epimerase/dehydratase family protein [Nocardioides panacisoli]|uniref:NAD-dependent epimerase/dehydratase family protein n=1 Tax=Nocardioides panacisoli TaxID=627624 RepID=UPI001C62D560|nr:NAD-dependent epimerase/dehydratase family protein [Nocardioides panacisoli]QYJ05295.1 NAD-dependent epimerase/dehydratase family protein [Nocardioides panacisoli]